VFEYLSSWPIILVTGPQRSGTVICSRMIEHDLDGYTHLDEGLWQVWDGEKARDLADERQPCILQGPGILKDALRFSDPNCCVVLMKRDVEDIIASQSRIGWNIWAEREIQYYVNLLPDSHILTEAAVWVATAKYDYWETYVRDYLSYWKEVEYESLSEHPLWVPKDKRRHFGAKQYKQGSDNYHTNVQSA